MDKKQRSWVKPNKRHKSLIEPSQSLSLWRFIRRFLLIVRSKENVRFPASPCGPSLTTISWASFRQQTCKNIKVSREGLLGEFSALLENARF